MREEWFVLPTLSRRGLLRQFCSKMLLQISKTTWLGKVKKKMEKYSPFSIDYFRLTLL